MNHLISLASLIATPPSTDSLRDSLALHSERWFIGVFAFGFVVALGCVAEAPETRAAWIRWRRARGGLALASEDEKSWHKPAAAIGLIFVIVGIVGETICEGYVSVDETAIRAIDESKLSDAVKKAAALDLTTQGLKAAAATAKGDMVKAQLELARITGPPYAIPVDKNGLAKPNLSKSTKQSLLLTADTHMDFPTLPRGESVNWTLTVEQGSGGPFLLTSSPFEIFHGNRLMSDSPGSRRTCSLTTDWTGTRRADIDCGYTSPTPSSTKSK